MAVACKKTVQTRNVWTVTISLPATAEEMIRCFNQVPFGTKLERVDKFTDSTVFTFANTEEHS